MFEGQSIASSCPKSNVMSEDETETADDVFNNPFPSLPLHLSPIYMERGHKSHSNSVSFSSKRLQQYYFKKPSKISKE